MEFALAEKRNSDSWDYMDTDEITPKVWLRRKEVKFLKNTFSDEH